MEFHTLIETLDNLFERNVQHIKKYQDSITYNNPSNTTITIDENEYTPNRLCLLNKNNTVYLYINTLQKKYHKLPLANIENITEAT